MVNPMIVAWIFNTIHSSLQPSIAYVEDALTLWDDLKELFSVGRAARLYQLKNEIS